MCVCVLVFMYIFRLCYRIELMHGRSTHIIHFMAEAIKRCQCARETWTLLHTHTQSLRFLSRSASFNTRIAHTWAKMLYIFIELLLLKCVYNDVIESLIFRTNDQ